jgi:hypothetical protein
VVRRTGITLSLAALLVGALALPQGASAGHPSRAHHKAVVKHCKAMRAEMGAKSFKRAFGKGKHKRHAFGTCVKRRGTLQKVSVRSETPPSTSTECPPGTVPEQPQPVSAFGTPACVAAPPPATCEEADSDDADEDEANKDSDDGQPVGTFEDSDDESCEASDDDQGEDSGSDQSDDLDDDAESDDD